MGLFDRVVALVWQRPRGAPDICPWCGEPIASTAQSVLMDDERYHGECAAAGVDAGVRLSEDASQIR